MQFMLTANSFSFIRRIQVVAVKAPLALDRLKLRNSFSTLPPHQKAQSRARRRHGLRRESCARAGAVPPRDRQRWRAGRLWRRDGDEEGFAEGRGQGVLIFVPGFSGFVFTPQ